MPSGMHQTYLEIRKIVFFVEAALFTFRIKIPEKKYIIQAGKFFELSPFEDSQQAFFSLKNLLHRINDHFELTKPIVQAISFSGYQPVI